MKILLAVDGSDNSYEAVRALQYLARAEELILVHVMDVPIPAYPAYPMMVPEVAQELYETMESTIREDGTRLLDRIVSLLPLDVGPVTKHLIAGHPAEQITALAEQSHADIILLGTRGLGPIKERLIGSVAHRVLTFAPGAKLILPGPLKVLNHILLPLQDQHDADHALRFLEHKPFREVGSLTLLTVLPRTRPPWPVDAPSAQNMEVHALERGRKFLQHSADKLAAEGYHTKVHAVLGTPIEAILQQAEAARADLIMLGSRGHHGLARMVLGSVSHALLHQATYPLLIFGERGSR